MTALPACLDCGKPRQARTNGRGVEGALGRCNACYKRLPEDKRQALREAAGDTYELSWAAARPERRIASAKPAAADLVRCVAATDAEGVRLLLHKFTARADWQDWAALAIVLAECASPGRVQAVTRDAAVCGQQGEAAA